MFFKKKTEEKANGSDDRIKVDTSTITTMVGVDTVITGGLSSKSSVRINGTVIGDVRADGVVVLTKTGHIEGTIEADSIIVAGIVHGNMSIRDKVNVEATGEIYGEVITKKFVIDEESIFQGNCIMNREGEIIPVTPYVKDSDKKEDDSEKEQADTEEKSEKESDEESDSKKKDDDKKDSKDDKEPKKDKEKESEDKKEDKEPEEGEDKEEKDSKEGKEPSDEPDDDAVIIADINDVKNADDIPASDGKDSKDKKGKKPHGGYVKKSKSLSVEVEDN